MYLLINSLSKMFLLCHKTYTMHLVKGKVNIFYNIYKYKLLNFVFFKGFKTLEMRI